MEWYGTCYHILIIYIFQAVAQQSPSLQCGAKTFNKLSFDPPVRSGLFSAGRLMYVPLEQLVNGDICQLVSSTSELTHSSYPFTNFQQIITICGNCTECPSSLNNIYLYLERMLKHMKISLIVIIRGINHRQINNFENDKRICFAFIEDEIPTTLNDCLIVDNAEGDALRNFSKTSVLFVSISFIILMAISLVWLVFYYVQRFRYAHAKDRLQRRLFNAAKKALARIPTRSVRVGDEELDADCPVCIDPYQTGDIVRSLPCRHTFHKTCVDPWLLEHRTCPMCKNDILKAFGYHVSANHRRMPNNTRQQSIHQMSRDGDRLSVDVLSSTSSELVIPYAGQSEVQDPFNLSSTTPPQLVQVMHCSSANTFSIIPLTVHNVPSPSCVNETQPITNQEQKTNGETRKISWHIRRPSTAGHIVSLVHVRSRSLSHAVSSEIPRPKVTFRSYTFGSGLATLRVPSSGKRVEPMINGLPSTFASDMSNSISCCIPSTDCYMPAKCSSKRVSLKEKRRPKLSGLASVESL